MSKGKSANILTAELIWRMLSRKTRRCMNCLIGTTGLKLVSSVGFCG
jgi:hypothetical protein